ncbi:LPS export ABC transporter periplasmic protein LptC [Methylovorus sp. MM2]|uniref:LPS export ABC transporter periplasmic protein LptC n=1 Tax=Methylovorus sp. MM2 TaxID=1848038 RepID=UPI0007DF73FF|nr:LPS export ABC transporter periplasmic protein LptC [Methylovorus sp. MM2]OAM51782.1 LPS export ABC transporter periplasmic protein LptC [Methylovorus sp. MM2]
MYGRSTILFPLALLALLALLTLWIDRSVQPPEKKPDGNSRHDPDYILHDFVTSKTDINGKLQYMLAATEMKHYPDDDSTSLIRPRFTQYATDKPYTQIEAQRGTVSSDGEVVEFMDKVKVVRQAFKDRGEMTVFTEYLKVFPKTDIATTDKPILITQAPNTVIHANAMVYDKKRKVINLSQKVRVHYERPAPIVAPASARSVNTTKSASNPVNKKNSPVPEKAKPKAAVKNTTPNNARTKKTIQPNIQRKSALNQQYRNSETS